MIVIAGRICSRPPTIVLGAKSSGETAGLVPFTKMMPAAPSSLASWAFTMRGPNCERFLRGRGCPRSTMTHRSLTSKPSKLW